MKRLREIGQLVLGAVILVGFIVLFNIQYSLTVGDPRIPELATRWWGGYIEDGSDRVWSLVRFDDSNRGDMKMVLITGAGEPAVFEVDRNTSDETFVRLEMRSIEADATITAQQLYEGKRYHFQRLFAGRLTDFWRKNDEVAIRGDLRIEDNEFRFEIEPIEVNRVESYVATYLLNGETSTSEPLLLELAESYLMSP